jgi:hypothetical protein
VIIVSDHVGALIAALKGAGLEAAKRVPGVPEITEGIRAYKSYLQEQQEEGVARAIEKRIWRLEQFRADKWAETAEAREYIAKIVSCMLDTTNADKIEFFANALVNYGVPCGHMERLKFVELIRSLSTPSLMVLAYVEQIYREKGPAWSPQVLPDEVIKASQLEPWLVHACINELYAAGVFSSEIAFYKDGRSATSFSPGTPAFTDFSQRFTDFLRESDK